VRTNAINISLIGEPSYETFEWTSDDPPLVHWYMSGDSGRVSIFLDEATLKRLRSLIGRAFAAMPDAPTERGPGA
jgi:hypothetical protein